MEENIIDMKDTNNSGVSKPLKCYIYKDDEFIDSIYAQQFDELPDIGVIEYIDSKSVQKTQGYSSVAEYENRRENAKDFDCEKNDLVEKFGKRDESRTRVFGEINHSDVYGNSFTRIFTNIEEIKQMKNAQNQKTVIDTLIAEANKKNVEKLINVRGKLKLYEGCFENDKFKELLVKINNDCLWLKQQYINADLELMAEVLQDVNVLAYIVSEEVTNTPRIIKALVIYV